MEVLTGGGGGGDGDWAAERAGQESEEEEEEEAEEWSLFHGDLGLSLTWSSSSAITITKANN